MKVGDLIVLTYDIPDSGLERMPRAGMRGVIVYVCPTVARYDYTIKLDSNPCEHFDVYDDEIAPYHSLFRKPA